MLFGRKRKSGKKNKAALAVDLENLILNTTIPTPQRFSTTEGFAKLLRTISREINGIVDVFVFLPPHMAATYGRELRDQGFFLILCPRTQNKASEDQDTVDSTLIKFAETVIIPNPEYSYLCIGSGDKDFGLLAREASRAGLRIIIVAGNLTSLSIELIGAAEKRTDGSRMVFIFSPTIEE